MPEETGKAPCMDLVVRHELISSKHNNLLFQQLLNHRFNLGTIFGVETLPGDDHQRLVDAWRRLPIGAPLRGSTVAKTRNQPAGTLLHHLFLSSTFIIVKYVTDVL